MTGESFSTGDRLRDRVEQIQQDIDELELQVSVQEVDPETAERLRSIYLAELADAHNEASTASTSALDARSDRSTRRRVVGGVILLGALALSVGLAGQFVQQRDVDSIEGVVSAPGDVNLDDVSDEAMLAVIDSYSEDPQYVSDIPRMRFALAERKFANMEYEAAFDQYESILQADPPPPADLAAPTLTRVAWIVWLNGETDLALSLVDRSLELVDGSPESMYVKAQILWCAERDADEAASILEQLSADQTLDEDVRTQVAADLASIAAGEGCFP